MTLDQRGFTCELTDEGKAIMEPITENGKTPNTADDTTARRLLGVDEPRENLRTIPQTTPQQRLAQEWSLNQQIQSAKNKIADNNPTPLSLAGDLGYSAVYSGIQSPAKGLVQLMSPKLADAIEIMEPPRHAEFGTAKWHAQTVGDATGMILPFMLTHGALKKAGLTFVAKEQTSVAAMKLAAADTFGRVADSALTGFVYDFAARPVDMSKNDFWAQRTKNGATGAITFGTLSAAGAQFRSSTRSLAAELVGAKKVAYEVGVNTVSGIPAGIVNAETASILNEGRLATAKECIESGYSMVVAGGALGLAEGTITERTRGRLAESERAKRALEASNRESVLRDREARHGIVDAIERATEVTKAHKEKPSGREHWLNSKDAKPAPETISPENSISLRKLAARKDGSFKELVDEYYKNLREAMPRSTSAGTEWLNIRRLQSKRSNEDTLVLRNRDNKIVGGVQYYLMGDTACVRDLWLKGDRSPGNISRLAETIHDHVQAKGAKEVAIENSTIIEVGNKASQNNMQERGKPTDEKPQPVDQQVRIDAQLAKEQAAPVDGQHTQETHQQNKAIVEPTQESVAEATDP